MSTERYNWDYTRSLREVNEDDAYLNWHVIARDTKIAGGAYFGTYGGEAIVVDTRENPVEFSLLFSESTHRLRQGNTPETEDVLRSVFDTVNAHVKYSQERVDWLLKRISNTKYGTSHLKDGTPVFLSRFIRLGAGVCRHQALTCGALLEMYKKKGLLEGDISIDRNSRWAPNGEQEGHAWARYTSPDGEPYILDVAQGYFGRLEDASSFAGWNYARPHEQEEVTEMDMRKLALNGWWNEFKQRYFGNKG